MDEQRPTTGGSGKTKKIVIDLLIAVVLIVGLLGQQSAAIAQFIPIGSPVLTPDLSAKAFQGNINTFTLVNQGKVNAIKTGFTDLLIQGGVTAVVGAANYFFSQLAYSAAVALTSECPGQKVCWDSKAFSDGFTQAWQGAVGDAIGRFGEAFGVNLCNPGAFALKIKLGLLGELKPPPPKCDFNAVARNWKTLANTFTTPQALVQLSAQFNGGGQAPITFGLEAIDRITSQVETNAQRAFIIKTLTDASGGGGFSALKNPVSGRTLSPPEVTKQQFDEAYKNKTRSGQEQSSQVLAGQIASRAAAGIAATTVRTFVQTIIAREFGKLLALLSEADAIALQPDIFLNAEGQVQGGTTADVISTKFSAPPPQDAGLTDPLEKFTVCPGADRTQNNCVIDNQFATAVRVSEGTPLTVAGALQNGLLHGDWPLISAIDKARDQDPFCYTSSYCESNLKKLRSVRILPVGWEVAAHKSPTQNPFKLKDVVAKFNDCNSDGQADDAHPYCHLIDPNWLLKAPPAQCRALVSGPQLLTPNVSERAEVCTDQPTCLKTDDFGTCIGGWGYCSQEKNIWRFQGDSCPADFNSCRRLTARVGGEASYLMNTVDAGICNADNVGCKSYSYAPDVVRCTFPAGRVCDLDGGCTCPVSAGACTVPNGGRYCLLLPSGERYDRGTICTTLAGCSSFAVHSCTIKKGESSCVSSAGSALDKSDDWLSAPSRFFNANVETCSSSDGGCTAIRPLGVGQSLNLVKNGSFEVLEDGDGDGSTDHPADWIPFGRVPKDVQGSVSNDAANAVVGQNSVALSANQVTQACTSKTGQCNDDQGCTCTTAALGVTGDMSCKIPKGQSSCIVTTRLIQDGLPSLPKKTYTLSAVFKPRGGIPQAKMTLSFVDARGRSVSPTAVQTSITTAFSTDGSGTCGIASGALAFNTTSLGKAFAASCTFAIDRTDIAHATLEISGDNAYVDNIQLEEGGGSRFHEGYGDATTVIDAKIPSPTLGCTGEATDSPDCANFAGVCRENEVGCDRFTPTNGDAPVPAITGPQDACPRECVGYDTYKQEASEFDTEKFPVFFIPTTARSCTRQDVGCSEFTNLDTESREYYSQLRLCQKPDAADNTVFYSWEGSDTVGFQLKVWNLKRTGSTVNSGSQTFSGTPPLSVEADFCALGCAAGTPAGNAPCTKIDPLTGACVDNASQGICTPADITAGNFDCREFYDVDGNRHFRLLSKTILATAACHPYRITVSTQEDCSRSDGKWNDEKKECVYNVSADDSRSCSAAANGCRAYKGNAADNVRTALADQFEQGLGGWKDASGQTSGIELSSESVTVGGHSLKIKQRTGFNAASIDVSAIADPGKVYTLSFWARGSGKLTVGFADGEAVQCQLACTDPAGCACASGGQQICTVKNGESTCSTGSLCSLSASCAVATGCPCSISGRSCTVQNGESSCFAGGASCTLQATDPNGASCTASDGLTCTVASGQSSCTVPTRVTNPPAPKFADIAPASCALPASCTDQNGCLCTTDSGLQCTVARGKTDCTVPTPVVNLTADWREYVTGPVIVRDPSWGTAQVRLEIASDGTQDDYIDTVSLKAAEDRFFVVRDSWKTPASCDETADGTPSPLEMLGCRAYTDSAQRSRNLKSFSTLCREQAVGCQAYSVSQNSVDPYEKTFNAVCTLPTACTSTGTCICDYQKQNPASVSSPIVLADVCRVRFGERDCRFTLEGRYEFNGACVGGSNAGRFCLDDKACGTGGVCTAADPATHIDVVTVPADERKYLVVREQNLCDATAVGCMVAGQAHVAYDGTCTLAPRLTCESGDKAGQACATDANCGKGISGNVIKCTTVCNPSKGDVCTCNDPARPGKSCSVKKGAKSCTYPIEEGAIDSWKTVAVKDDPEKYQQTLCTEPELACESFTASDSTQFFFKDPGDKTCNFKETAVVHICRGGVNDGKQCASQKVCQNPVHQTVFGKSCQTDVDCTGDVGECDFTDCSGGTCAAETRSGWFRKSSTGADEACYPELVRDGDFFNIYRNSDGRCSLPSACTSGGGCPCPASGQTVCRVARGSTSCGYDGWAGACEARYDRCEEFIDPLDTSGNNPSGQPYYYIVNSKIDLSSCDGTASLKQGCVLFRRTSDTRRLFGAAATYLVSDKDKLGGKQAPINCDGATRDSRCNNRCYGIKNGRCSTDSTPCQRDADCPLVTKTFTTTSNFTGKATILVPQKCEGDAYHSSGCSTDKDCNTAVGESCDDGSRSGQPNASFTGNDSNVIIKVQPDRACGQWLSCAASASVWDNQKNKWTSQCVGFGLCDKNDKAGEAFECVDWLTPPKARFTEDKYVSRDTRYFGQEYSGFSLLGQYPPQYVTPVTALAPGYCVDSGKHVVFPLASCSANTDCDLGACVDHKCAGDQSVICFAAADCGAGESCKRADSKNGNVSDGFTGICAGDPQHAGTPCVPPPPGSSADDPACGFGYCLDLASSSAKSIGALRYGIPRNHCQADQKVCQDASSRLFGKSCQANADCGTGACALSHVFCETNVDCPTSTAQFRDPNTGRTVTGTVQGSCVSSCAKDADCPDDGRGHGSCLGDQGSFHCMYDVNGGPLIVGNAETGASCRGYPEKDSPFSNSIVDQQTVLSRPSCSVAPGKCSVTTAKSCTNNKDCPGETCVLPKPANPPAGFSCSGTAISEKSGFGSANVCVLGNDCDCSYSKYAFGGTIRYQGYATSPLDPKNPGRIYTQNGACEGGPNDGQECNPQCAQACSQTIGPDGKPITPPPLAGCPPCPYAVCGGGTDAGTCKPLTSISRSLGWEGFCLEHDRSTNVSGAPDQFACNMWLPIDQLPGAQDIYNQARQAGFQPSQPGPILYCQVAAGNKNVPGPITGLDLSLGPKPYQAVLHDDKAKELRFCRPRGKLQPGDKSFCEQIGTDRTRCLSIMNVMASGALTRGCAFLNGTCIDRVQTCDPGATDQATTSTDIADATCTGPNDVRHQVIGADACSEAAGGAPFKELCGELTDAGLFSTCVRDSLDPDLLSAMWLKAFNGGGQLNTFPIGSQLFKQDIAGIKVEFTGIKVKGSSSSNTSDTAVNPPPQDSDTNPPSLILGTQTPQHYRFLYVYPSKGGTGTDSNDPGHLVRDDGRTQIYANSLRWDGDSGSINLNDQGRQYTYDRDTGAIVGEGGARDGKTNVGSCAGILIAPDANKFCDEWHSDPRNQDSSNCLAIGFEFDKRTGRLLKALTGVCHSESWPGASTRVTAELREQCTDLAVVLDSIRDPDQNLSAPQTNRLNFDDGTPFVDPQNPQHPSYDLNASSSRCVDATGSTTLAPYGRAGQCNDGHTFFSPPGIDVNSVYDGLTGVEEQPLPIFAGEGGSVFTKVESSAPRSVIALCPDGNEGSQKIPLARPVYTYDTACPGGGDGNGYGLAIFQQWYRIQAGNTIGGLPYACIGACGVPQAGGSTTTGNDNFRDPDAPATGTLDDRMKAAYDVGADNLAHVFARSIGGRGVFEWDQAKAGYVVKPARPDGSKREGWDQRVKLTLRTNVPQARPVDVFTCDVSGQCGESLGEGMTVNGTSSGQVVGVNGRLKAAIQYYAHADKDHMPIRGKIIDFGDEQGGADVVDSPGFFMNRRGAEVDPKSGALRSGCDGSEWGRTSESCQPRYFEEIKTYLCSQSYANSLRVCGTGVGYPCQRNGACVFKPRVQIRDNWGICNGTCTGGSDGKDICMDDECKPVAQPGDNPWTEFAGEIIVQP